jgi:hypothetical protein
MNTGATLLPIPGAHPVLPWHPAPARLPPGYQHTDHGGTSMPSEHERRSVEIDRADRQVIQQAAAQLRHGAIMAGYAGLPHMHLAFALALVLDELALHVRDLRPEVRAEAVRGARMLLGSRRGQVPPVRVSNEHRGVIAAS